MAVKEIGEFGSVFPYQRFIGLSTDTKPTAGIPVGSTFFETDTGSAYAYDGTNWVLRNYPGRRALTPTKYAATITSADTEYSQALPAGTKQFSIHLRDMSAFRLAYVTGKVATPTDPYETIPAGAEKYIENVELSALTLYFAAPVGGKVAEIEAWV